MGMVEPRGAFVCDEEAISHLASFQVVFDIAV